MLSAPLHLEEHFTPTELAEKWKLSHDTIIRWFQDEPGVLKVGGANRKRIRLRIPVSVARKVYERHAR